MATDALATQGARASVAMILAKLYSGFSTWGVKILLISVMRPIPSFPKRCWVNNNGDDSLPFDGNATPTRPWNATFEYIIHRYTFTLHFVIIENPWIENVTVTQRHICWKNFDFYVNAMLLFKISRITKIWHGFIHALHQPNRCLLTATCVNNVLNVKELLIEMCW